MFFIGHTTVGKVCFSKDELFSSLQSYGTYLSSGVNLIMQSDLCEGLNILMIFSDGDNCGEDNETFIKRLDFLSNYFDKIIFFEIKTSSYISTIGSLILDVFKNKKNIELKKINFYHYLADELYYLVKISEEIKNEFF